MATSLEPVTASNRDAVCAIEVRDDQLRFLDTPSMADFLDEAPLHPTFTPFAVVEDGIVVGFVSAGTLPEDPSKWWVSLLRIDAAHQGRGHGRAAMEAVIALARYTSPAGEALGLGYKPDNEVAAGLYRSLGFEEAGLDEKGEMVAWLRLDGPRAARP